MIAFFKYAVVIGLLIGSCGLTPAEEREVTP